MAMGNLLWRGLLVSLGVVVHGRVCEEYFCAPVVDIEGLRQCMNGSWFLTAANETKQYAMLVSASREQHSYEFLSLLINGNYAQANNYSITYMLESESIARLHKTDWQWNKVSAAMTLLYHQRRKHGYAGSVEYLIVLDQDVIVLDTDFDVAAITYSHPDSDIILFSDTKDGINADFFIVKNTPWSLNMLYKWWELRRRLSDAQEALCKIYDMHLDQQRQEIRQLAEANAKGEEIEYQLKPDQMIVIPYAGLIALPPTYGENAMNIHYPIMNLRWLHDEVKYKVIRNVAVQLCRTATTTDLQQQPPHTRSGNRKKWPVCADNYLSVNTSNILHLQSEVHRAAAHSALHTLQTAFRNLNPIHDINREIIDNGGECGGDCGSLIADLTHLPSLARKSFDTMKRYCDGRLTLPQLSEGINYHRDDKICVIDNEPKTTTHEYTDGGGGVDTSIRNLSPMALQGDCMELFDNTTKLLATANNDLFAMNSALLHRIPTHVSLFSTNTAPMTEEDGDGDSSVTSDISKRSDERILQILSEARSELGYIEGLCRVEAFLLTDPGSIRDDVMRGLGQQVHDYIGMYLSRPQSAAPDVVQRDLRIMHSQAEILMLLAHSAESVQDTLAAAAYGHRASLSILRAVRHETMSFRHPSYAIYIAQFVKSASFTAQKMYSQLHQTSLSKFTLEEVSPIVTEDTTEVRQQGAVEAEAVLNIITEAVKLAEMIYYPSNTSSFVNHARWGEVLIDTYLARLSIVMKGDQMEVDWKIRKGIWEKLNVLLKERSVRVTSKQRLEMQRVGSLLVVENSNSWKKRA